MSGERDPGVVIVGASHAATQLAHGLRRCGYEGAVTIVGEEQELPYHKPPLSKDFLKGKRQFEQILLRPAAMYDKARIDLRLGRRVTAIDRGERSVALDDGSRLRWQQLVLTTGARPRRLPVPGAELDGVCYVRTVADIERLRAATAAGARAVVVGGGYIGLEVAASLRSLGMQVSVVEAEERLLSRITCPEMSDFFARVHREEGVALRLGSAVAEITGASRADGVRLASGEVEPADVVVVGIGIEPDTALAEAAGLDVDDGIVVDEFCRSSDPDIFAAGDCARCPHPLYGDRLRLESVQNAHDQAMVVAHALTGDPRPYADLPWFWSDQYDVKLQIAGLSAGCDRIVTRGDPASGRSFALCYFAGGRLVALDAVNRPKDFVQARKLIAEGYTADPARLADPETPLDFAAQG